MSKETVEVLRSLLGNCPEVPNEFNHTRGLQPIRFEKQVLVNLWYQGNNEPCDLVAERFDVGKTTSFS